MSHPAPLPYKIAVLAYLFDHDGRVLLLHRQKSPNRHLYSPIGGKLEQHLGESPTACALREIREEVSLHLTPNDLHLTGIVSEAGYEDQCHWLMFLYEVLDPRSLPPEHHCPEGALEWFEPSAIDKLPIPDTDRQVIWPLFWRHRRGFFAAHIHCHHGQLDWQLEQSFPPYPPAIPS
ncbi:MAG: NUDIX domain-containing protein [Phycisphaeraceae bacterium]|nr:NUDIX domain-containing protein [Phycisphaeraceae bacterium]